MNSTSSRVSNAWRITQRSEEGSKIGGRRIRTRRTPGVTHLVAVAAVALSSRVIRIRAVVQGRREQRPVAIHIDIGRRRSGPRESDTMPALDFLPACRKRDICTDRVNRDDNVVTTPLAAAIGQ